jgi:hypothetical protein
MVTGFELDNQRIAIEQVKALNRLAKAMESMCTILLEMKEKQEGELVGLDENKIEKMEEKLEAAKFAARLMTKMEEKEDKKQDA